jgi:ATP/maltotriose-dependent transcriptional regulator MalT
MTNGLLPLTFRVRRFIMFRVFAFLKTCDVPGWEAAETEMMGLVGLACYRLGRLAEAERWLMGTAGDHHPLNIQMRVTRGLGQIAQSRGQLDVAEQYYEDFALLAGQSDSPFQRACATNDLSTIADLRGDLVTAERLTRRGLAISEEHGYQDAMTGRVNLCGQLLTQRAYREARAAIDEILGQGDAAWSPVVRVMVQVFLLRIHTALGQWHAWEVARLELYARLKYEDWAEHSMARVLGEGAAEAAAVGHIDEAQYMGRIALEQWGRLGLVDKAEALRATLASWA